MNCNKKKKLTMTWTFPSGITHFSFRSVSRAIIAAIFWGGVITVAHALTGSIMTRDAAVSPLLP